MLRGNHAFDGGDPGQGVAYAMFVWVVSGGERPVVVDTGPKSVREINRGLQGMCVEPVSQREGEDLLAIMARSHVDPNEVGYVFLTHLHYDHVSNLDMFPNARIVVDRTGYQEALRRLEVGKCWVPGEVMFPMRDQWCDRMVFVGDEEVLPGIRTFHAGGHTPCSMCVSVRTRAGRAVITGDVVSLYENIERDVPIGVYESRGEVMAAMSRIRTEADIVLPSHDPRVLERHRGGAVG